MLPILLWTLIMSWTQALFCTEARAAQEPEVTPASPQDAFEAGVAATHRGDHSEAVDQLGAALEAGARDPAVYHGLGNAHYRQGNKGLALAAWRRAQLLAPRDGDIAANVNRARKESQDRIDPPASSVGPFFWQGWLSPREGALLAGGLWCLAWTLTLVRRLRDRPLVSRWSLLSAVAGTLLALSTALAASSGASAVVLVASVSVRSALGPDGIDLFVLHEGAEVAVLETDRGYTLIQLPDARKGWLPDGAVASTDPSAPFPPAD